MLSWLPGSGLNNFFFFFLIGSRGGGTGVEGQIMGTVLDILNMSHSLLAGQENGL